MKRHMVTAVLFVLGVVHGAGVVSAFGQANGAEARPVCDPDGRDLAKEVRRVPPAIFHRDETGAIVYTINANESWRRTSIEAKRGQRIEISATGFVRWAPGGIEKIDVTPDGTRPPYRDGWNYYHFPFPEAGIGSLVMRIGKGVYSVGSSASIEAEDSGFVEFMVNDDKLDDNSGAFHVKINLTPSLVEPVARRLP